MNQMSTVISVRVTPELRRAVEREAKRRYLRPADLLRRILSDLVLESDPEQEKGK